MSTQLRVEKLKQALFRKASEAEPSSQESGGMILDACPEHGGITHTCHPEIQLSHFTGKETESRRGKVLCQGHTESEYECHD